MVFVQLPRDASNPVETLRTANANMAMLGALLPLGDVSGFSAVSAVSAASSCPARNNSAVPSRQFSVFSVSSVVHRRGAPSELGIVWTATELRSATAPIAQLVRIGRGER